MNINLKLNKKERKKDFCFRVALKLHISVSVTCYFPVHVDSLQCTESDLLTVPQPAWVWKYQLCSTLSPGWQKKKKKKKKKETAAGNCVFMENNHEVGAQLERGGGVHVPLTACCWFRKLILSSSHSCKQRIMYFVVWRVYIGKITIIGAEENRDLY